MFTDAEVQYLTSQPLGRLATVGPDGRPHVMPVGVFWDPETKAVVIGGHNLAASKKFRDAQRHPEVAVVVDDLAAVDPWTPRGIEIRGEAETHTAAARRPAAAPGPASRSARPGSASAPAGSWPGASTPTAWT